MNRRDFLRATALGTAGLMGGLMRGFSQARAAGRSRQGRPNVLFIICDDLNDSVAGMGGHPQAKTPNIDRLMRRGVRFTNAHSNAPLCGPSRASLWSGLYPSTTGFYKNWPHFRKNPILKDARTMQEHFMATGYDVYGTGKVLHHKDWKIWKREDGFNGFGIRPSHGPWAWDGSKGPDFYYGINPTGHPSMPRAYREGSKYLYRSFGPLSDVPDVPPDPAKGAPGYKGWMLYGKPFRYVGEDDRDLMPDELSAQWAVEKLEEKRDRPFFMVVGFMRPHTPMYAPRKYFDMFPYEDIKLPPYLEGDLDDCAEILKASYGKQFFDRLMTHGGVKLWRLWIQAYLACVALVDDQLGKILDALEKGPYADNTIVIFTSDHGYHMGEKDNLFKLTVWEESTRVPLVVSAPGITRPGTECDKPISLIDMYPTLIDLCGLSSNPNAKTNNAALDGCSIQPFLKNPEKGTWDGPEVALSVIYDYNAETGEKTSTGQNFTVRSRHWRYTLCLNGEEELYDHRKDPNEWTNLAKDPKYADIKKELWKQLLELAGSVSGRPLSG